MTSNPLLSGFHPDPSIVRAQGGYYLVNSTFEYLPALPIHHSTDLLTWRPLGHVATRPEQVALEHVPTPGGVWAPTIRYRDGVFFCIVSVVLGGRGCVVFTTTDPAGAWSDGVVIDAVDGIDPDLAWDDDGTAFVTFARHPDAIQQVRVDLDTGAALEAPRALWVGSGLYSPEGPHLYRREGYWYLVVAEGGTDRGHAVTVARSRRPDGPFESCPANPVLTAAGTGSLVQNLGHADLVDRPDGSTAMVLLGVRPLGLARSFSPLGRETFLTTVDWIDGWPRPRMPAPAPVPPQEVSVDFGGTHDALTDPAWIAVRRPPAELTHLTAEGLVLEGDGGSLGSPLPTFVGRRQQHLAMDCRVELDVSAGTGGLGVRNAEDNWFGLEGRREGDHVRITARAVVASFDRTWEATLPLGDIELAIVSTPPPADFSAGAVGGDRIRLLARSAAGTESPVVLAELDGRHWSFETAKAFTGRVIGPYAVEGRVVVRTFEYQGSEGAS